MIRFQEAQELFHTLRNADTCLTYHRAAWTAYLSYRISEEEVSRAMSECEAFWGDACT